MGLYFCGVPTPITYFEIKHNANIIGIIFQELQQIIDIL